MSVPPHVLIVEARFYVDIADGLAAGAIAVLERRGVAFTRCAVPGAFEIPAAIRYAVGAAETSPDAARYAGFIALGCVIRGETDHYDHICREATHALMAIAIDHQVALGFGVLTCENYEQARIRAAIDGKNKGADAAEACLRMIELKQSFGLVPR